MKYYIVGTHKTTGPYNRDELNKVLTAFPLDNSYEVMEEEDYELYKSLDYKSNPWRLNGQ